MVAVAIPTKTKGPPSLSFRYFLTTARSTWGLAGYGEGGEFVAVEMTALEPLARRVPTRIVAPGLRIHILTSLENSGVGLKNPSAITLYRR